MPYNITTRNAYTLSVKFCSTRVLPQLFAIARPLASQTCYFDIGTKETGSYPLIRSNMDRRFFSIWDGPYLVQSEASIQRINLSDYFVLGSGSPLCQQQRIGSPVSLIQYATLSVSTQLVGNDTTVLIKLPMGLSFENANKFTNSWLPLPSDAFSGNSPILYDVLLYSGNATYPKKWWQGRVNVLIKDEPTNKQVVCDVSFGSSSLPNQAGQTQTGMGVTGGAA